MYFLPILKDKRVSNTTKIEPNQILVLYAYQPLFKAWTGGGGAPASLAHA